MASLHKMIEIKAAPAAVWDAVQDIGAIHRRLCPGFVVATELEHDRVARWVTFANGMKVREVIIDCDPDRRRLAWTVESPQLAHHNGVMQIFEAGSGLTRAVWTADILPHSAADTAGAMMEHGLAAMKTCLEA